MQEYQLYKRTKNTQWLGHIWRRNEDDIKYRITFERKPTGKRPRGRQRKRWLDVVEEDLDRTGVQEWRDLARDREKWRDLVMTVKTRRQY